MEWTARHRRPQYRTQGQSRARALRISPPHVSPPRNRRPPWPTCRRSALHLPALRLRPARDLAPHRRAHRPGGRTGPLRRHHRPAAGRRRRRARRPRCIAPDILPAIAKPARFTPGETVQIDGTGPMADSPASTCDRPHSAAARSTSPRSGASSSKRLRCGRPMRSWRPGANAIESVASQAPDATIISGG